MQGKFKKITASILSAAVVSSGILSNVQIVYADTSTPENIALSKWTIGVYACGSDLESDGGETSSDILEMLKAQGVSDDINIVIETGGSTAWHYVDTVKPYYKELGLPDEYIDTVLKEISADYIQRYKVVYNNTYSFEDGTTITYPKLEVLNDNLGLNNPNLAYQQGVDSTSMGNEKVFEEFLLFLQEKYPSEHTLIDMWNHGGGTVGGVCFDGYDDDSLSISELKTAVDVGIKARNQMSYDVIGFDACIMANYETLELMAPYAQYAVAALTNEPGYGWYYTTFLEELAKNKDVYAGAELSKAIVDSYEEFYKDNGVGEKKLVEEYMDYGYTESEASSLAEKSAMDMFGEATLSVFNLQTIASTLTTFDCLAENLLYLMQDKNGFKGFQDIVYDNAVLDTDYELICFKSFLELTNNYAQSISEKYRNSKKYSERNIAQKYYEYAQLAEKLDQALFTGVDRAVIKEYKGWEGNKFYNAGPMTLYYPTIGSSGAYEFIDSLYPVENLSAYYALFAYSIAYDIQDKYYEDFDTTLKYNRTTGKYTYSIPKDISKYQYALGLIRYCTTPDGKNYYLGREDNFGVSQIEQKSENSVIAFNGVPITIDNTYADQGYYGFEAIVNGYDTEIFFYEEKGRYYLGWFNVGTDEFERMSKGDIIIPKSIVTDSLRYLYYQERIDGMTPITKGKYQIKAKDAGEVTSLPITKLAMDKNKLSYIFCVIKNSLKDESHSDVDETIVNNNKILLYSKAKATIAKKIYKLTGKQIKPKVSLKSGKNVFKKNKDYKVSYKNNIGLGKATITVTGKGQYEIVSPLNLKFTIKK